METEGEMHERRVRLLMNAGAAEVEATEISLRMGIDRETAERIQSLEKDRARLDWFETQKRAWLKHDHVSWLFRPNNNAPPGSIVSATLREAIDAAMDAEGEATD